MRREGGAKPCLYHDEGMAASPLRAIMESPSTNTVAMIGTREPTPRQEANARICGKRVAELGLDFVSGGARGIDSIAQEAHEAAKSSFNATTVYRPEDVTDENRRHLVGPLTAALGERWANAVAAKGDYVLKLALRNVLIVQEADVVLAWPSPGGGGTAQGIAIAKHLAIPCFNMNSPDEAS